MEFPFTLTEEQILSLIVVGTLAVVAIVGVNALAPKAGVAAPLVLVLVGVVVSFVPAVPEIEFEPEWILAGILPPLLYSAAVGLPTMDFRRDFTAISGLSVVLVVISAVLLGYLFTWLIPGIPLAAGIALGAIVSPTDAVATSIVKRLGASPRVVTLLEGESLLNDASALVLLRSAIAGIAVAVGSAGAPESVSVWSVAADFVFAVVVAVVIGFVVGFLGLFVRRRLASAALGTAVSFVVPFIAYLPAEELGASGLVAVVTAGLVTGNGAAKYLRPQHRIAEESNWRTVELVLEGGVFLLMGLELFALVSDVQEAHGSVWGAIGIAALAAVIILVVRSAYVATLLRSLARRARHGESMRGVIEGMQQKIDARFAPDGTPVAARPDEDDTPTGSAERRGAKLVARAPAERVGRIRSSLRRRKADIDYLTAEPLGWREGTLLVWAGMRGVVTLAAAQTLPLDTPQRSFLVLVAFGVAAGTLVVQGGTLPWVVRWLGLSGGHTRADEDRGAVRLGRVSAAVAVIDAPDLRRPDGSTYDGDVVARVRRDVVRELENRDTDAATSADLFAQYKELRLRALDAQRTALLDARSSGAYSSQALRHALDLLDAEQIDLELRRGPYVPGDDD
jgi:NhaP-type Na+/H+ or K+/H+ antiporter